MFISVNHCFFFIDQTQQYDPPGVSTATIVLATTTAILFCVVVLFVISLACYKIIIYKLRRQAERPEQVPLHADVNYGNVAGGGINDGHRFVDLRN